MSGGVVEVSAPCPGALTLVSKFKSENPDNDTVLDAVAANAYVEQFGLEVFNRAEATMRANKVTKCVQIGSVAA